MTWTKVETASEKPFLQVKRDYGNVWSTYSKYESYKDTEVPPYITYRLQKANWAWNANYFTPETQKWDILQTSVFWEILSKQLITNFGS